MITIVVPTYNRRQDLDRCLRALRGQTLPPESFEVIVVDDGSTDTTPDALREWAAGWPQFRWLRQSNSGPAAARNRGIREAKGSVIAFTDDDCVPAAQWTQIIHDRFKAGLRGCLHGVVTSAVAGSAFVHSVVAHGAVITSNLAVERSVFDEIGFFDVRFRAPWCEDADIYYRMRKYAVPITYDPDLVVDHPPRYQRFAVAIGKSKFFQYYALIALKHPEMEPISKHLDRVSMAIKKIGVIALVATALHLLLRAAVIASLAIAPAVFCAVDGLRLMKMKSSLKRQGMHVRWQDQVMYVLFNWTSNLLETYYLIKGVIIYRSFIGRTDHAQ